MYEDIPASEPNQKRLEAARQRLSAVYGQEEVEAILSELKDNPRALHALDGVPTSTDPNHHRNFLNPWRQEYLKKPERCA